LGDVIELCNVSLAEEQAVTCSQSKVIARLVCWDIGRCRRSLVRAWHSDRLARVTGSLVGYVKAKTATRIPKAEAEDMEILVATMTMPDVALVAHW